MRIMTDSAADFTPEELISAIGSAIAGHIGPNAYGLAFVEAE